jgi:Bacterial PH domain
MVFRSRIDAWLLVVLSTSAAAVFAAALHVINAGAGWFLPLLMVLVGVGLPLWLLASTKYTIALDSLTVQSGPFFWRIKLTDVIELTETRSVISSPALSLDRVAIKYKSGKFSRSILVSPKDKTGFIHAISAARAEA